MELKLGLFTGGNADEIITPNEVSATVATGATRPSNAADTITGGGGADTIDGGGGDDLIDGGIGADRLAGGNGADTFLWNPGGSSDTVDGGAGIDALQFNMANIGETIGLSTANGHLVLTRDIGAVAIDIDNVERIAFGGNAGGSDGYLIGDLSGTDLTSVAIDLAAPSGTGDGSADRVEIGGGAGDERFVLSSAPGVVAVGGLAAQLTVANAEALDTLAIAAGGGADTVDASALQGGIALEFDGGDGIDLLTINGQPNAANTIVLSGPLGGPVSFDVNGAFSQALLTGVETISVTGGDAGDSIFATNLNPIGPGLVVAAGKGADTVSGGRGAETIDGGAGNDLISGGGGNDLVLGGADDDAFVWNPGDGSDVIDGGAGFDTLQFNMANIGEVIGLSAAEGHAVLTRNIGTVAMDLDNVERIAFGGNAGGADRYVIGDLAGTDVLDLAINLAAPGGADDGSADTVELTGGTGDDRLVLTAANGAVSVGGLATGLSISNAGAGDAVVFAAGAGADTVDASQLGGGMSLQFDGSEGADVLAIAGAAKSANSIILLGGAPGAPIEFSVNGAVSQALLTSVETIAVTGGDADDTIVATSLVPGGPSVIVDAGKGADTVFGSRGAETIDGGAGDDQLSGGGGNDLVLGGSGDDAFVWNPGDGSDMLDGGHGVDTLRFNTANIAELISVIDVGGAVVTRDIAGITMQLTDVEQVAFGGNGGGADRFFFGELSATDIRRIDVDLGFVGGVTDGQVDTVSAIGGAGADRVVITGEGGSATVEGLSATVNLSHAEAGDRLTVNALDGDDRFDLTGFEGGVTLALSGGNGSDRFTFGASTGATVEVQDFRVHAGTPAGDVIVLDGFVDHSLAEALAHNHIVQSGADVVVSDDLGLIVTLRNVLVADLGANDFLFS